MSVRILAISLCLIPLISNAVAETNTTAGAEEEIENLRAFTRLYGYVRFFHPTDEAAETNWEHFALSGSAAVRDAPNRQALATVLKDLFAPIAPTVAIYDPDVERRPHSLPAREDVDNSTVVVWQHKGVGLQSRSTYRSVRTNRERPDAVQRFAAFTQVVDAASFQGREIRLRAAVRMYVHGEGNVGGLWLRVDRPDREMGFFENMQDRPITAAEWTEYEITGRVDDDGQSIAFGGLLIGDGEFRADGVELSARDEDKAWQEVPVYNGSFEVHDEAAIGWHVGAPNYIFEIVKGNAYEGDQSLSIRYEPPPVAGSIFDFVPSIGTAVDKPIGAGLRAFIPIALTAPLEEMSDEDSADNPATDPPPTVPLEGLTAADENVRFAGIVIAWNVLQHFYPYFDVIETDWDNVLTTTLVDARDDRTVEDYVRTLRRMVAELEDGHGNVYAVPKGAMHKPLPLSLRWIEDRAVVTRSAIPDTVLPGDVLLEIDGRPVREIVDEELQFLSGTLRWKLYRAVAALGSGEEGSTVQLKIDRDGETPDVDVVRGNFAVGVRQLQAIEELDDSIYYVDLTRAEWSDIGRVLDALSQARGVIFDVRGYPKDNHEILSHLVDEPIQSAIWNVPQIVLPDQEDIVGWDESGRWLMPPREPRIRGRIVFMTDATAISYAESIMGIVENYNLGEIVGEATAGANGNINWTTLPGDINIIWTGMKVLKHDGAQHHLIGIQPTIPVKRTIEGVRAGVDEFLEAAKATIEAQHPR